MATGKEYPLSLVIRAVDKLTGPLARINASLKATTSPFSKLGKEAKGIGKAFNLKSIAEETGKLGARLFGLTSVAAFAFATIVHGAVEAGDHLKMMAQRTGVSVDFFASYAHAAQLADIEQEEFNSGMDKFSKALGAAKAGGGSLLEFLNKVSPKLALQVKNSKNAEEGLALMTDAFVRLKDPQKRAILATEAFGRSGQQFGEFLHQGSAAIQKQQIEYLRLAGSQEAFATAASALDDALRDMYKGFLGLRNAAAAELFPALTQVSRVVTELVVSNRTAIAEWARGAATSIKAWVDGGGVQRLAAGISDLGSKVSRFVEAIGGMKTVAIGVGLVLAGPLLAALAGAVPAVISLGSALLGAAVAAGPISIALVGVAAVGLLLWKNWSKTKEFFDEFFPDTTRKVRALADAVRDLYDLWARFQKWSSQPLFSDAAGNPVGPSAALGAPASRSADASWFDAAQTIRNLWRPGSLSSGADFGPGAYERAKATRVEVDFKNVPKGTRITQTATGGAAVDLSTGFAMTHP